MLACARQVEAISRDRPEHLGLIAHTHLAFAYAHVGAGRAADAAEAARAALELFRQVDREYAGKAATYLADALLRAGDAAGAQAAAREAIALCRRSLRAVYEAEAQGVLARALMRSDGAAACEAAEAALTSAAALIERTGATTLAPFLCEWRAELAGVLGDDAERGRLLRDAQQGYEAIGAPKQVERMIRAASARPGGSGQG